MLLDLLLGVADHLGFEGTVLGLVFYFRLTLDLQFVLPGLVPDALSFID
jgi:hypothetical protein